LKKRKKEKEVTKRRGGRDEEGSKWRKWKVEYEA
jgi:hypothetical protein